MGRPVGQKGINIPPKMHLLFFTYIIYLISIINCSEKELGQKEGCMKTNMNPNSIVPLYEQVAEFLKRDIENGVYNATGKIPTEAELAEQYKVSRITIRKAMDNLVGDGLVEKKQGKGTFIRRQKFAKDIKNLQSFSEMCRHMNMKPGGQMLENKLIPADDKIQKQLNLEPGAYVVYISRLRTADGEPVTIERNYFPVKYSFLLEKKFDDNSLFECLQEEAKVRVISSEKQIELCRATAAEAKLMKVKKGAPLLYIKSVAYTYDREPLYAGAQVFNGEVCSLYVCESVEQ